MTDMAIASDIFDELINKYPLDSDITNEAETRQKVIDKVIYHFLGWTEEMVKPEIFADGTDRIDYLLQWGTKKIVIEAKKWSVDFPSSHNRKRFTIDGSFVKASSLYSAIEQCTKYSIAKGAYLSVATNGRIWAIYQLDITGYAKYCVILNPFVDSRDIRELHKILSLGSIETGAQSEYFVDEQGHSVLYNHIKDNNAKLERNNIARFIMPVIDGALNSDFILSSEEMLRECYVMNDSREKYDQILCVHLDDSIIRKNLEAKRASRDKKELLIDDKKVQPRNKEQAPPIKLLIGSVGAGKTTYLKHFELIAGKQSLADNNIRWISIDLGRIGDSDRHNVGGFIIDELYKYIIAESKNHSDWKQIVLRAYRDEREFYRKTYSAVTRAKEKADEELTKLISSDISNKHAYVERFIRELTKDSTMVILLDNIDLFEDQDLEKRAFSEGVSLAKKFKLHVIVSVRDSTYSAHKNSSTFDAYEIEKLWLDPPIFREVLSRRLDYSSKAVKGTWAKIPLASGMYYEVDDLSKYFDLLRSSILADESLTFYEAFSDNNIRKGIELIKNFITSGHVQADAAIRSYLLDGRFRYAIHEIFKASVLWQWKYYSEEKCECINILSSKINDEKISLARLYVIKYLYESARIQETQVVKVDDIKTLFCHHSISLDNIIEVLKFFQRNKLIRTTTSEIVNPCSSIFITRSGAYYINNLVYRFHYVELCITDSFIYDEDVFAKLLKNYNESIVQGIGILKKMRYRKIRMGIYLDYLEKIESENYTDLPERLKIVKEIKTQVVREINMIIEKLKHRGED